MLGDDVFSVYLSQLYVKGYTLVDVEASPVAQ